MAAKAFMEDPQIEEAWLALAQHSGDHLLMPCMLHDLERKV